MDLESTSISKEFLARLTKRSSKGATALNRQGYAVQPGFVILRMGDRATDEGRDGILTDWAATEMEAEKKVAEFYAMEEDGPCESTSKTCQKRCKTK